MVDFTKEFYDSFPRKTTFTSYDSCSTDEGYYTDEKPQHEDHNETEIPILNSNRIMLETKENVVKIDTNIQVDTYLIHPLHIPSLY